MVKSILRKSRKQKGKKHTKRVRFNKYKKVKTFKNNKKIKSKKPNKGKTRKGKKANKKKKGKKTKKRKLKLKMKGGYASNMGEKVTGIKLNPQEYQHPESTNLNSSVPYPYQNGGSMWDTLGLGDIPLIKNGIINSGKNVIANVTGNEEVVTGNPVIHPEMEKSLLEYPKPINIYDVHQTSQDSAVTELSTN